MSLEAEKMHTQMDMLTNPDLKTALEKVLGWHWASHCRTYFAHFSICCSWDWTSSVMAAKFVAVRHRIALSRDSACYPSSIVSTHFSSLEKWQKMPIEMVRSPPSHDKWNSERKTWVEIRLYMHCSVRSPIAQPYVMVSRDAWQGGDSGSFFLTQSHHRCIEWTPNYCGCRSFVSIHRSTLMVSPAAKIHLCQMGNRFF